MLSANGIYKILFIIVFFQICCPLYGRTYTVGKNRDFNKISDAVHYARDNDTLLIEAGYYAEGAIVVDKKLTLLGIGYPIISGENKYEILRIVASGVTVKNILFKNAGVSFIDDNSAVRLDSVSNCVIENNKFYDNFFAIYLAQSRDCIIRNNVIKAANKKQTTSANGIHLWYCKNIVVDHNLIEGHRDGIYFEFVVNSIIENNTSRNNLRYGLHFMFSDSCIYTDNNFINNKAGVAVMFTRNVEMKRNNFENNWGAASYGLLLKEIYDSIIEDNTFKKNTCGIYYESCGRVKTANNLFLNNGWAIRLMANSMDNVFTKNKFIDNTFDVATNSSRNFNTFEYNYWNKYDGYDLDRDGLGDVPYRPVNLFSYLVVKNPPLLILLRSLFIELLNYSERIMPVITPSELTDNKPLMNKDYDTVK
jgi:nitrous oxidase accessory protein